MTDKNTQTSPGDSAKEVIVADIGGTNARFAIAKVLNGKVLSIDNETILKTADYATLQLAWDAFGQKIGRALPKAASMAIACPIRGDILKFSNSPWIIRPALLADQLDLDEVILINDFEAVAHAAAHSDGSYLKHIFGPKRKEKPTGVTTIVGPGTGLGVASLIFDEDSYRVIPSEGGHITYAPCDHIDISILRYLKQHYRRVSAERIISGPGLGNIYDALAASAGLAVSHHSDSNLWDSALKGTDHLAAAALERFCLNMGTICADIALVHLANRVIISGGIGQLLADYLPQSGFGERFVDKGRFERMLAQVPVELLTYPQPGLLGAAAAYAVKHTK
ncbi:Glucokinase (Glk) (PDB:1Q18) [Commensalibacter communis]|uniref:Glucokinase (Glk) n=1 Tax=Commensalibacter communis TaxID=2972786 RepID=A0A9W4TQ93_9PROT|nr:glucokinase [Commensalibacter communis]CAI3948737.1 Glucokinase (Glk) (PDB:1Q18) [Commensalibacter communis]CAI3949228.1 Glucokinase (Glk) (PDB:1Q18) [Commensalibacter communis]CAI3949677.1 Glucokinase (Glk) (PDB:1Q18) [Commensalibacter communis]CAI3952452.1 Glucokinase (Glk) (PDB:1Q18) [Commensalibacter communis]CAI3954825.1 Glucokinase (Glk) (PDB:1Q18) [Commensalibacter communis]